MKELLKSKTMILFVVFIFGVIFLNSYTIKQEQKSASAETTNTEIIFENNSPK